MKIPKTVMIIGVTWTIVYRWNLRDKRGAKLDGHCVNETKTIFIERSLTKEEKELTYLHELYHSYINEAVATGVKDLKLAVRIEESIVDHLSRFTIDKFILKIRKT